MFMLIGPVWRRYRPETRKQNYRKEDLELPEPFLQEPKLDLEPTEPKLEPLEPVHVRIITEPSRDGAALKDVLS